MIAMASGPSRSRGFALIIVLWFLVLIGAIGIYLILHARAETAIAHNTRAAADAEALADAGIARAAFNQLDPVLANRWRLDAAIHGLKLPAGDVNLRLMDETQKINANLASPALLAGLFEASGVDRIRARRLGAAIADWVSPDGPARDMGAKLDQYRAAGKSYGPPNAPLESLDDLNLVLGMTPEILARARPYLTIYGKSAKPNPKGAPAIIQRALSLSGEGTVVEEEKSPVNMTPLPEPGAPPPPQPEAPQAAPEEERLIAVEAEAHSRDGGTFIREAVLRLKPENPERYDILDWRRGEPDQAAAKLNG
jgi:general secretion pathway protein K